MRIRYRDENGEPDEMLFEHCPSRIITAQTVSAIELFTLCDAGTRLPFPGAVADQPSWLMAAFDIIRETIGQKPEGAADGR